MVYKKLTLSSVLILIASVIGLFAQNLYIMDKSGLQSDFELENIQKITFDSENLNLVTNTQTFTFGINDLRHINFEEIVVTGNQDFTTDHSELHFYPNPVNDILYFNINNDPLIVNRVDIYSMDGKLQISRQFNHLETNSLSVKELYAGMYIIRLSSEKQVRTAIIIKQ